MGNASYNRGINTAIVTPEYIVETNKRMKLAFANVLDHPMQRLVEENWVDYLAGAFHAGSRPEELRAAYWKGRTYLHDGKQRKTGLEQEGVTEYWFVVSYPKTQEDFNNLFIAANYRKLINGKYTALAFGGESGALIRELYDAQTGVLTGTNIDPSTAAAGIYSALTGREKAARSRIATTMDSLNHLVTAKNRGKIDAFVADMKSLLAEKSYKTVAVILGSAFFRKSKSAQLRIGTFNVQKNWDAIGHGYGTYEAWHKVIDPLYK